MELREILEIKEILGHESKYFQYFKGRYQLMLLSMLCGERMSLNKIKSSSFGKLLNCPQVKKCMSSIRNKSLASIDLANYEPESYEDYWITISCWGDTIWDEDYHQTSRPGYNLVLQLNFGNQHNMKYYDLFKSDDRSFVCGEHPVNRSYKTMAWCRMDIDFDRDQVLIEEIQNDWIRYAIDAHKEGDDKDLSEYVDNVLKPYRQSWDEAMLSAAIQFIKEDLGIGHIYYHTNTCGYILKNISKDDRPPESLYKKLPKRFCFELVEHGPTFLYELHRGKNWQKYMANMQFYYLSFN